MHTLVTWPQDTSKVKFEHVQADSSLGNLQCCVCLCACMHECMVGECILSEFVLKFRVCVSN